MIQPNAIPNGKPPKKHATSTSEAGLLATGYEHASNLLQARFQPVRSLLPTGYLQTMYQAPV